MFQKCFNEPILGTLFESDESSTCVDHNECLAGEFDCPPEEMCFNYWGGYTCIEQTCEYSCNKNYCVDNPAENSVCKCILTGYGDQCVSCPPGQEFASDESGACVDIEPGTAITLKY